jgi:hypothetical protein
MTKHDDNGQSAAPRLMRPSSGAIAFRGARSTGRR